MTYEKLKQVLNYDPDTGIFTWKISRGGGSSAGDKAGYKNRTGYMLICFEYHKYCAHRLAVLWMTGKMPKHEVDHINGIRDDNRWINLRDVTTVENKKNTSMQKRNKSGVIGVCFNKAMKKWHATIGHNGKRISLGLFEHLSDATEARRKAETKYGYHKNHGKILNEKYVN